MFRGSAIDTWGSSAAERADSYPCDGLLPHPDRALYRAIDVAAPAAFTFRRLCQLRVAPYSYDWIDNFGRRSPRELIDGLDALEVGQTFATIFRLAQFEPGRSLTLDSKTAAFGDVAMTYAVTAVDPTRSRIVVKIMFRAPRAAYGPVVRLVLPAGDLVMMRKQLLNLRTLAERDAERATR